MTDIPERDPRLLYGDDTLRDSGYYYSFDLTGVEVVDRILAAVAAAGKGYHHTEDWNEPLTGDEKGRSFIDLIQEQANNAASYVKGLEGT